MLLRSDYLWLGRTRGIFALLIGLAAVFLPRVLSVDFAFMFALLAVVVGVMYLIEALINAGREDRWWLVAIYGTLSLIIGLEAFLDQGISLFGITRLFATWLLLTGIVEAVQGYGLEAQTPQETLLVVIGAVTVVVSIILMSMTDLNGINLNWALGIYAIFWGALTLAQGMRARINASVLANLAK